MSDETGPPSQGEKGARGVTLRAVVVGAVLCVGLSAGEPYGVLGSPCGRWWWGLCCVWA